MSLSLGDFKSKLRYGGARANQFKVTLGAPTGIGVAVPPDSAFFIKASSLPGSTIDEVAVNYRGRVLYVDGDRTFDTWTTTIINDVDFQMRNFLENWHNAINNFDTNQSTNALGFMGTMTVEQMDRKDDVPAYTYELKNCWPTVIAPIELSWDTRSEIETFDVTWRYTEFTYKLGTVSGPA